MRPTRLPVLLFGAAVIVLVACTDDRLVQPPPPDLAPRVEARRAPAGVIPGQYIIVLRDDVAEPVQVATQLALAHRLTLRHTYRYAVKGFSAIVPEGRLEAIRQHPLVAYVQPNRYVTIHTDSTVRLSSAWALVAPPALQPPTNLNATASSATTVTLSWTDNSTGETGTKVERRTGASGTFSEIAEVGSDVTLYTDAGLSAGATYCYRTRTYRAKKQSTDYSAYSDIACATTPAPPPAAPSNASSTPMAADRIDVAWNDNSGDETGFSIERRLGQTGTFSEVSQTGANATSIASAGLAESTEYCHRIRAFGDGGYSSYSNITCATTSATPSQLAAPSNVVVAAPSPQWVTVQWSDNSTDESGFRVERRLGQFGTFAQIAQLGVNATSMLDQAIAPLTE